jgi:hypothetical protein
MFIIKFNIIFFYFNKFIQTGYENWIHFSTFAKKMEIQKKLNGIAGNTAFYVTMLSKNVGCSRLGYPALLQLLFYQSDLLYQDNTYTYSLLNIEIHNFKSTVTWTFVKNSDNIEFDVAILNIFFRSSNFL